MVAAPLSATESLPTALGPGPHHPIRWFPCPPGVPGPRQHGRWVVASCRAPYLTGHSRDLCTHSHPRPKGASENSVFVQCLCWVVLLKGLRQALGGVGGGGGVQEGRGLLSHWESEGPIQWCSSSSKVSSDEDDTGFNAWLGWAHGNLEGFGHLCRAS